MLEASGWVKLGPLQVGVRGGEEGPGARSGHENFSDRNSSYLVDT